MRYLLRHGAGRSRRRRHGDTFGKEAKESLQKPDAIGLEMLGIR